jgi:hypothetical protein
VLGIFQRRADMDRKTRLANLQHGAEVEIVNSHDPVDYDRCACGRAH